MKPATSNVSALPLCAHSISSTSFSEDRNRSSDPYFTGSLASGEKLISTNEFCSKMTTGLSGPNR